MMRLWIAWHLWDENLYSEEMKKIQGKYNIRAIFMTSHCGSPKKKRGTLDGWVRITHLWPRWSSSQSVIALGIKVSDKGGSRFHQQNLFLVSRKTIIKITINENCSYSKRHSLWLTHWRRWLARRTRRKKVDLQGRKIQPDNRAPSCISTL